VRRIEEEAGGNYMGRRSMQKRRSSGERRRRAGGSMGNRGMRRTRWKSWKKTMGNHAVVIKSGSETEKMLL